mgnify:CR=1 FL=1
MGTQIISPQAKVFDTQLLLDLIEQGRLELGEEPALHKSKWVAKKLVIAVLSEQKATILAVSSVMVFSLTL